MKPLIVTALLFVGGCQPIQHLNEPVRSEFYAGCMFQGGWPVSGCDCLEQGAFTNGAPTYIVPGDDKAGDAFGAAANKAVPECRLKTQELMKDGGTLPKPAETKKNDTDDLHGSPSLYPRGGGM